MQPLETRTYSVPVVLRVLAVLALVAVGVAGMAAFLRVRLLGVWALAAAGMFGSEVVGRAPWSITVGGDGWLSVTSLRGTRSIHVTEITSARPTLGVIHLQLHDGRIWTPVRRARRLAQDLGDLRPALATPPGRA
jgi:hypothetical protein